MLMDKLCLEIALFEKEMGLWKQGFGVGNLGWSINDGSSDGYGSWDIYGGGDFLHCHVSGTVFGGQIPRS